MFIGLQLISLWSAVLSTPEMSGHNSVIAGSVKFTVLWFGKNTDSNKSIIITVSCHQR